eukprot:830277-Pyramimonas_sp.AAC.1
MGGNAAWYHRCTTQQEACGPARGRTAGLPWTSCAVHRDNGRWRRWRTRAQVRPEEGGDVASEAGG